MIDDQLPVANAIVPIANSGPRLVGDGRGLMFGVLGLTAVLFAVCILLLGIIIARGTGGMHRQPGPRSPPAPRVQQQSAAAFRPDVSSQVRHHRGDLKVTAARRPLGDAAEWITADDYPASALRKNEQGTVTIRWRVGAAGRVTACEPTVTRGFADLDSAACSAIVRRGRYPAVQSATAERVFARRVVWRIPS